MLKFRKCWSAIAVMASLALAVGLSAPAQAATNVSPASEVSSAYIVDSPSNEDLIQAKVTIEAEKLKDQENFNRRVSVVRSSPATMEYIKSYSGVNIDLKVQSLAVSMPLEPLARMPAAAVTCALGFGLGGLIVDFNAGCK